MAIVNRLILHSKTWLFLKSLLVKLKEFYGLFTFYNVLLTFFLIDFGQFWFSLLYLKVKMDKKEKKLCVLVYTFVRGTPSKHRVQMNPNMFILVLSYFILQFS